MKRSLPSMVIIITMLAISCGKDVTNNTYYIPQQMVGQNSLGEVSETLSFSSWKELMLNHQKNNQALAKIFVSHIDSKDAAEVSKFIEENLSIDDANRVIEEVGKRFQSKKDRILYHQAPWSQDKDLLNASLMNLEEVKTISSQEFYGQLMVGTAAYIQSKFLTSIIESYSSSIHETAKELAPQMAKKLMDNNPIVVKSVEADVKAGNKEGAIAKLKDVLKNIDFFNQIRSDAQLKDHEVIILGLSGVVAAKIYEEIKDTKSFKQFLNIVEEVKLVQEKVKKASSILNELNSLNKQSAKEITNFKGAASDLNRNSKELFNRVYSDIRRNPESNVEFKDKIKILYDDLYKNKKRPENHTSERLGQYYENVVKIDQSFNTMATSIKNVAGNFDRAVAGAVQLMDLFGVKIGKDGQKILKAASTASKVLNIASATMAGFATGGYVGAATALIGSAGPLLGGDGGAMKAMNAKLEVLDQKLDEVIKLQQQTIKLQVESMKMIRDLAIMVDEYHKKEMQALANLRDIALTNLELNKATQNKDIRACESLISFQLDNATLGSRSMSINFDDASMMGVNHKFFYADLKKRKSFKQIIKSTNFNSYADCQTGISEAFGRLSITENPILATYSSSDEINFVTFDREIYRPLAQQLFDLMGTNEAIRYPLHLPMAKIKDLERKYKLMERPLAMHEDVSEVYELTNLISPITLSRYASSLLILYPLLDFDRMSWEDGPEAVIDQFFSDIDTYENSNGELILTSRSLFLLKNALYLTQSAIAQEALLSGEPILNLLMPLRGEIFKKEVDCLNRQGASELACAVRTNPLLVKNLLRFIAYKNADRYIKALKNKNKEELEDVLSSDSGYFKGKLSSDLKKLTIMGKSEFSVEIPEFENGNELEVIYSENMIKLLKLQELLTDAILSTSPQFFSQELGLQYSALILQNQAM